MQVLPFSTASSFGTAPTARRPLVVSFALGFVLFWAVSFAGTTDLANWWIENLLVFLFSGWLLLSYRRFPFSDASYGLILLFLLLHTYGAKYAYADNPLGFWLQRTLGTARNPYDRIVHCSFGLLMAYPMREIMMRYCGASKRWATLMPVEVVLSLSGLFELVEWSVADVFFPAQGKNYVGSQGDIWDAQKDMALATAGAVVAMLVVGMWKRLRNRKRGLLETTAGHA